MLFSLLSYDPKCSLKIDYNPEKCDPGSNSAHTHINIKGEKCIWLDKEKSYYHTRGDRKGFNTVVSIFFSKTGPDFLLLLHWTLSPSWWCWFSLPQHFWTHHVTFRTVSTGIWAVDRWIHNGAWSFWVTFAWFPSPINSLLTGVGVWDNRPRETKTTEGIDRVDLERGCLQDRLWTVAVLIPWTQSNLSWRDRSSTERLLNGA